MGFYFLVINDFLVYQFNDVNNALAVFDILEKDVALKDKSKV